MPKASLVSTLGEVTAEEWNALIGDDNPFLEHAFLELLEDSGSVGEGTGWIPRYVLVHDGGKLVGAAPAYIKDDSYGEYIFDWSWAEAAAHAGIAYYPKIVVGVPFTPATGPRLLCHPDSDTDAVRSTIVEGLDLLEDEADASGSHILFALDDEAAFLEDADFARRGTQQYHWHNEGYETFDDYLSVFKSSSRKQIKKERRRIAESGIHIELVRGDEAGEEVWETIYKLYLHTYSRKWGRPYLTQGFFEGAAAAIGPLARIAVARVGDQIVATTLSFEKGRHLYGRYWGAFIGVDALHFELCFYQLIEHAIATQKTLFEAGAQGQHKIRRGFVPVRVHSGHRLRSAKLHDAIVRFTRAERAELSAVLRHLSQRVPFRKGDERARPRVAGI